MRIKLACFLFLVLAIAGCKKENDRAFDKSPDERLNETLEKYQTQLEGGTNGWMGYLTTDEGRNYTFYFKFNNQNRVVMYSDFTTQSARVGEESSYRLKALQQVSLLFDTYSYIHVLADPDPAVAGGALGAGYSVDFEFYFDNATNDTINLVGRKHENKMKLVRATPAQEQFLAAGSWGNSVFSPLYGSILHYWKTTVINGVTYQVNVDATNRTITFTWAGTNGEERSFTTSYYETLDGIVFNRPLQNGNSTVTGFSNITWNLSTRTFSFAAGGENTSLTGSNNPAFIDKEAPNKFRKTSIDADSYWYTTQGYHINGVDAAYNLSSLIGNATYPTFYYYLFWPDYNPGIDVVAPIFRSSSASYLPYGGGMVYSHLASGAGRFVYTYVLQRSADWPQPTSGPHVQMRNQIGLSSGHYFVKINETTYDMVSVADARNWVTWYLF